MTLSDDQLERAATGAILRFGPDPAPLLAAFDTEGSLVGILRRHEPSGSHRLRPNFRGVG